jgi:hypothetical protein
MKHRAPSKSSLPTAVAGGMMAAGAVALICAAPAGATTRPNGNPTVPPKLIGHMGLVPKWAPGTFNANTCPGGVCFNPRATTPFPTSGSPSKTHPIIANPAGTGITIGLSDI